MPLAEEYVVDEPSNAEWSALYQAAIAFQEAAPWQWIDNEDLFAIENPDGGEAGYCSILGSGGEEFGLGMFPGEDGYKRYSKLIAEEEIEDLEETIMARGISMLFVDREVLQKEDREIIRSLDLRFRGRNAWPFFRSQKPGYFPWFLEKAEVVFLTTAIQQALVVAGEVRRGKLDLYEAGPGSLILTRFCRGGKWHEEWRKTPKLDQRQETHSENVDLVKEAELHLLKGRAGALSGRWELDIFALPIPIGEPRSGRPHFPLCFLAVETKLGVILDADLTEPWLTISEKQDKVIKILRKLSQLPVEIRVKSDKVRVIVEPVTRALGIKLRVGSLTMLEEAKASLEKHFSGR